MSEYKYTLIISQYRWSRHQFIVEFEPDFLNRAKAFAAELIKYKRGDPQEWHKPIQDSLSDLTYHKEDKVYGRYNINDIGDIYFINSSHCNSLKNEAIAYAETSLIESRGYKKKAMVEDIQKHHNFMIVKEILEKYFAIA
jgi:hypothetical protein